MRGIKWTNLLLKNTLKMKNKIFYKILINIIIYFVIILGMTLLYSPFNELPQNEPKTNIQFIYQQF